MILSITKLTIKKPWHFFPVSYHAFRVMIQLKFSSKCKGVKTIGVGFTTYTMTLWENEEDMNSFYRSGAHKVAMVNASKYAQELGFLRLERNSLIEWPEAKELMEKQGKISFK